MGTIAHLWVFVQLHAQSGQLLRGAEIPRLNRGPAGHVVEQPVQLLRGDLPPVAEQIPGNLRQGPGYVLPLQREGNRSHQ